MATKKSTPKKTVTKKTEEVMEKVEKSTVDATVDTIVEKVEVKEVKKVKPQVIHSDAIRQLKELAKNKYNYVIECNDTLDKIVDIILVGFIQKELSIAVTCVLDDATTKAIEKAKLSLGIKKDYAMAVKTVADCKGIDCGDIVTVDLLSKLLGE